MPSNSLNLTQLLNRIFKPDTSDMPPRRHDLDWLRILAFGLLILFHSGMFYTENWGFHAKSQYRSETLESIMLLISPWRMAILWVISGIAIKFILAKVTAGRFIYQRSVRLLIPLLFGVLVVVPPQLYVEMTQNNDLHMGFWQFMVQFYQSDSQIFAKYSAGIWPHIDVNHLWFLRSLWQYSLIVLLIAPFLNSSLVTKVLNKLMQQHYLLIILCFTAPLYVIQLTSTGDNTRYFIGFTCMLYGYLIGWNPLFWQRITRWRMPLLISLMISAIVVIIFYNLVWLDSKDASPYLNVLGLLAYNLMRVLGILTSLAFAYHYLNKPSVILNYLNDAVYPFYILHQTLIIIIGYHLTAYSLGPIIEPILLITFTILGCFSLFEIIKRIDLLRVMFGLKMQTKYHTSLSIFGRSIGIIAMLIIGIEIIL